MTNRILPNFIYIGAPKAGSSTLYEHLKQHPEIYMCPTKEPFFFDFNYEKGVDWYSDLFRGHNGQPVIGEATVWYMRWKPVPARVAETLDRDKVKFLAILRNPIDRAWSNYSHNLQSGRYTPDQTFSYVIRNEHINDKINRTIVSGSFYHEFMMRWLEHFRRDQFLILLYDDLCRDIHETARRVYTFLDVDPEFRAVVPEDKMVTPQLKWRNTLIRTSGALPPFRMLWKRHRHFRQLFYSHNAPREKMSSEDREYLRELFRPHNERLAEFLGTDLSHWK